MREKSLIFSSLLATGLNILSSWLHNFLWIRLVFRPIVDMTNLYFSIKSNRCLLLDRGSNDRPIFSVHNFSHFLWTESSHIRVLIGLSFRSERCAPDSQFTLSKSRTVKVVKLTLLQRVSICYAERYISSESHTIISFHESCQMASWKCSSKLCAFYRAVESAVMPQYVVSVCPSFVLSVCPSVCLWRSGMFFTHFGILRK